MSNIFTKGLDKDDRKEGIFKRLKNIKDKNQELLNAFNAANKFSKGVKNESEYNYDNTFDFYDFYRGFKNFKRMSVGSKCDDRNDFYTLLNAFINTHKVANTKTKNRKERVMKKVMQLYNDYFDVYKKITTVKT